MAPSEVMRLAARAMCDPRSVQSYLSGMTVRPLLRERIERAAQELGIALTRSAGVVRGDAPSGTRRGE